MSWTPEHKEMAKALWKEGLSAGEIIKRLPVPVTRNAIIGVIHRAGLFRSDHPAAPGERKPKPVRRARPARPRAHTVRTQVPPQVLPPAPVRPAIEDGPGLATVLTLQTHMCRWPIGDPLKDDFTFCGQPKSEGAYCAGHARLAYQPAQSGKKTSASELARSLRRYI